MSSELFLKDIGINDSFIANCTINFSHERKFPPFLKSALHHMSLLISKFINMDSLVIDFVGERTGFDSAKLDRIVRLANELHSKPNKASQDTTCSNEILSALNLSPNFIKYSKQIDEDFSDMKRCFRILLDGFKEADQSVLNLIDVSGKFHENIQIASHSFKQYSVRKDYTASHRQIENKTPGLELYQFRQDLTHLLEKLRVTRFDKGVKSFNQNKQRGNSHVPY